MKEQEFRTRYPGYNVLDKWSSPDWDDQTRLVVHRRLEEIPPIRFFNEHEARTLAAVAERIIPQQNNVVKLHETERDQYGLPVPHVLFGYHDNDQRIIGHAIAKMREILKAAGGEDTWSADRTAHLLGTCRMGNDPRDSVVNADCRAHDVPNLFICDGSVFPTSTAVNPSLTIEAIAARAASRIGGDGHARVNPA